MSKLKRELNRIVDKVLPTDTREHFRALRRKIGIPSIGQIRRVARGEMTENCVVDARIAQMEQRIEKQSESIRWLVDNQKWILQNQSIQHTTLKAEGSRISIIMPVWNREHYIAAAIQSVLDQSYANWELIIVDDGSSDATIANIKPFLNDARISLIQCEHVGVCRARNRGLEAATGDVFAYLDSDNQWTPNYLQAVAETFVDDDNCKSTYAAQLVENEEHNWCYIRDVNYSRETYLREGGIDLNIFAHRIELFSQYGGFDENLTQLVDWDLIARYTQKMPPKRISIIGCRYREAGTDRISVSGNYWRNRYLIQRKWQSSEAENLRVLYVVQDYPQLTETYIRWEIDCMQRWGVDVHVWSNLEKTASPYPSPVPHYHDSLDEAMQKVKPNLVHFHWLNIAEMYEPVVARYGAIATVRGHGYEYSPERMELILSRPTFQALYGFPHFAKQFEHLPKMHAMTSAFNGDLYYPEGEKDRRLVVRIGSAKQAKATETFIDAAALCPKHRFVLILGRLNGLESYVEEVIAYNEAKGNHVEIRVNVPTEEAAEVIREAGIYLHTYGDQEPFGMPISIAEAMATGAYTLVRNRPGASEYIGNIGAIYDTAEEAANLIQQTEAWYYEDWQEKSRQSVEYAYQRFADIDVYRPMLEHWQQAVATGVDPATIIDDAIDPELAPIIELILEDNRATYVNVFHRPLLTHLLGTYRRLKDWGVERDICMAGLIHSLYNAIGQVRLNAIAENRERIVKLIGHRAEQLAYLFQSSFRKTFDEMTNDPSLRTFTDRFSSTQFDINEDDFLALATIHLAEWMEKRKRIPGTTSVPQIYQVIAGQLGGVIAADFRKECSPDAYVVRSELLLKERVAA